MPSAVDVAALERRENEKEEGSLSTRQPTT